MTTNNYADLQAYQLAFAAAMRIYRLSRVFPAEEKYSLIDQTRRSSRSVCANIAEGYRKRSYIKLFVLKLADSDGECSETQVWLDFSYECQYLDQATTDKLVKSYDEILYMAIEMKLHPEKWQP